MWLTNDDLLVWLLVDKRQYHCRAVFCWKRLRWFPGLSMGALGSVHARLECGVLDKLKIGQQQLVSGVLVNLIQPIVSNVLCSVTVSFNR